MVKKSCHKLNELQTSSARINTLGNEVMCFLRFEDCMENKDE